MPRRKSVAKQPKTAATETTGAVSTTPADGAAEALVVDAVNADDSTAVVASPDAGACPDGECDVKGNVKGVDSMEPTQEEFFEIALNSAESTPLVPDHVALDRQLRIAIALITPSKLCIWEEDEGKWDQLLKPEEGGFINDDPTAIDVISNYSQAIALLKTQLKALTEEYYKTR